MSKYQELKKIIMQQFWIFRLDGNNNVNNGNRVKIRIERNYKISNKK
jgi:hypothetical protein